MIFLIDNDLQAKMQQVFIDESSADYANAKNDIEGQMISLMKSKLGVRYDVDAIFAQTDPDRIGIIVKILTDLVAYQLVRRNAPRKVPSDFREDFEAAMRWLNHVRDGIEVPIELPQLDTFTPLYHGNSRNTDWNI